LRFTVGDGVHGQIAPGQVVVYLNGKPLVNGIDCIVRWPQVCVIKVPDVADVEDLVIQVRTMGWCDPLTMQPYLPEVGFVKDGVLSVNGRYDLRYNENQLVVIGDIYRPTAGMQFQETDGGVPATDGLPYAIYPYILPVEKATGTNTIDLIQIEADFKDRISDYITVKKPQLPPVNPVIIGQRWKVFSPVVSALIHSLNNGYLNGGELDGLYSNLSVDVWMQPFIDLLPFDLAFIGYDTDYIDVLAHQYPTAMELTNSQYRFVEYVIKHYLFDRVDLTPSVLNLG
jgi:hypothetical protein